MNRRAMLALIPGLVLAACAGQTPAPVSPPSPVPAPTPIPAPTPAPAPSPPPSSSVTIANDVALIASSFKVSVAILETAQPPLPANVASAAIAGLNLVQTAAADYAGANTLVGQQTAVAQLQAGIAAVEQAFVSSGTPIPTKFEPYLLAATALLPAIEIAVGLPAKPAAHARAILRGASA